MKKILPLLLLAITLSLSACSTPEAIESSAPLSSDVSTSVSSSSESSAPPETTAQSSVQTTTATATTQSSSEPPETTTDTTQETSVKNQSTQPTENTSSESTSTSATSTTPQVTTTASAATSSQAEPEEIPEAERTPQNEAEERLVSYGVDLSKRDRFYQKLNDIQLPIIHISTENKQNIVSREEYVNCLVDIFNCDDQYLMEATEAGIKVRGNSTAYYGDESQVLRNQVPYRIKFDKKQSVLGLNNNAECKSWVLLKSQWNIIPDYMAFSLAKQIFEGKYYSSDYTFTYVYVNERFKGLYLLCEQNQVNENRVDMPEVPKDYKGTDIGYFIELDNYAAEEDYYFSIDYCCETFVDLTGTERSFVPAEYSFKNDIYSQEQVDFIQQYISNVFKIIIQAVKYDNYLTFDENYELIPADTLYNNAYDTINAVVDLESVVDMYILYEICHDYDCGEGSFFMARDFSGESSFDRLTFTAPWDFNWAYSDSSRGYYAGAFNAESFVNKYGDRTNPWFVVLMSTDWFTEMVKEKWNYLYSEGRLNNAITLCETTLETYKDDLEIPNVCYIGSGTDLINWVKKRIRWLNNEWGYE